MRENMTLQLNWPFIAATLFLIVGAMLIWGAWNGKFSSEITVNKDEVCPELKFATAKLELALRELGKKEDLLFKYENMGSEQAAAVKDQDDSIKKLLDKIGEFSAKIDELTRENETLRKALNDALNDLAKCRGQLMQCKALATAKRLEHEFCNMTPGSMTLR
jgi:chromosome segregation ATPase